MLLKLRKIVKKGIWAVALSSAKPFSTGLTMQEKSNSKALQE
jgi:hypothetical protein